MTPEVISRIGVAAAVALTTSFPSPQSPRANLQQVFVSVIDARGAPVAGLSASDFAVALDGTRQTIESVVPAPGPISMALLTDRLGLSTT